MATMKKMTTSKMSVGSAVKKTVTKSTTKPVVKTTTKPVAKTTTMKPLTAEEKKYLQTVWEQRNKRPAPAGSEFVPSSENFRTRRGGFSVNIKPKKS